MDYFLKTRATRFVPGASLINNLLMHAKGFGIARLKREFKHKQN